MNKTKKTNSNLVNYLIFVILSFLFLLIFSNGTSPLTHYYGSDSAFFMFFGKCMKNGMIPYIDMFDHKGPYFFWIQELGQFIYEGKIGAFIVQIINLSISMIIADKIICFANPKNEFKKRVLFQIPLAWLLIVTFRDGNLTEEFSLPLLFLSLLLFITYLDGCNKNEFENKPIYALVYGISIGILALCRITNSAFICSIVLVTTIILIVHKEYKNLLINILAFIFGIAIAILPAFIYFSAVNGLNEMIKYVFVFAYRYSVNGTLSQRIVNYFTFENIVFIIPAILPSIYLIIFKRTKTRYFLFSCTSFLATFLATFLGFSFTHYFVLVLPNVLFGTYIFVTDFDKSIYLLKNKIVVISMIVLIIGQGIFVFEALGKNILQIADYSISEQRDNYYENKNKLDSEIGERIPDDEKDKVWGYGVKARLYLRNDMYPCIRFFDYLDQFLGYEDLRKEIIELYNTNKPNWLIISKEKENTVPDFILDSIEKEYILDFENEKYYLYRKI